MKEKKKKRTFTVYKLKLAIQHFTSWIIIDLTCELIIKGVCRCFNSAVQCIKSILPFGRFTLFIAIINQL